MERVWNAVLVRIVRYLYVYLYTRDASLRFGGQRFEVGIEHPG